MFDPSKAGIEGNLKFAMVAYDCTKKKEKFRFGVGDKVVFNVEKAMPISRQSTHAKGWIVGEVVEIDVFGLFDFYAVYKCSAEKKERAHDMYYVLKDNDEHIATSEMSKVRDRFLDAIEQGCSFEHFNFLVENFGMDLSPVVDLILEQALKGGSFEVLRWLEERMELDLASIRLIDGDTILHRMAASQNGFRFFSGFPSAFLTTSLDNRNLWKEKNGRNQDLLQSAHY